jgi:hypothetical protein
MKDESRRGLARLGPESAGGNGVWIAVERMDRGTGVEQAAGVAPRAESRIDDNRAGCRLQRGKHFFEQDGNMRDGADHAPFPFAFPAASAAS